MVLLVNVPVGIAIGRCAAGMMPVLRLRIIKTELYAVLFAGGREFLERIALEWRGVVNVVVARFE